MVEFVKYTSILGHITIAIEDDTLIGLWFDGQKYDRANIQGGIFYFDLYDGEKNNRMAR